MIRGGSVLHDFHPNRFLPYDELKSFNKKLDVIKDRLHTSDEQQDVFWDSSSMISVAAKAEKTGPTPHGLRSKVKLTISSSMKFKILPSVKFGV